MGKLFWTGISFIGGAGLVLLAELMAYNIISWNNVLTPFSVLFIALGIIFCVVDYAQR